LASDDHAPQTIHTLFCGFRPAARYAAARMLRAGQPASSLMILHTDAEECEAAASLGLGGHGWRADDLDAPSAYSSLSVSRIIVDLADQEVLEPLVRRFLRACPGARISVMVADRKVAETISAIGEIQILNEAAFAGSLLARSVTGQGHSEMHLAH